MLTHIRKQPGRMLLQGFAREAYRSDSRDWGPTAQRGLKFKAALRSLKPPGANSDSRLDPSLPAASVGVKGTLQQVSRLIARDRQKGHKHLGFGCITS